MGTDRTIRNGVRRDRLLQYGQLYNTGVRCELYYPRVIQTPYKYSKIKQTSVRLTIALSYICNKISSPNDMRYLQLCSLLLALSACSTHSPDIDVACEIDLQNNYLLKWETTPRIEGEVQVYRSTDPEHFDTAKEPVATASIQTGYTVVPDSLQTYRYYFLLRFNDRYDRIVGPRAERLKYIENFRDLGGYETKNGKQIRWGKIFRSGEFNSLTANSINRIKTWG